jgi:hypothetical protein
MLVIACACTHSTCTLHPSQALRIELCVIEQTVCSVSVKLTELLAGVHYTAIVIDSTQLTFRRLVAVVSISAYTLLVLSLHMQGGAGVAGSEHRRAAVAAVVAEVEEQAVKGQGPFSLTSIYGGLDSSLHTAAHTAAATHSSTAATTAATTASSNGSSSSSSSSVNSGHSAGSSGGAAAAAAAADTGAHRSRTPSLNLSGSQSPMRSGSGAAPYDPLKRWGLLRRQNSRAPGSSFDAEAAAAVLGAEKQARRKRCPIAVLQVRMCMCMCVYTTITLCIRAVIGTAMCTSCDACYRHLSSGPCSKHTV